jgi:arsenate reductase
MRKIYHLSSCSTCKRIIKELNLNSDFILQDIKTDKISEEQLNNMAELAGNYESLFSRRAIKYKELNLKDKNLSEEEYKNFILTDYTFLKRPVVIIGKNIFAGNSKKVVESAIKELHTN